MHIAEGVAPVPVAAAGALVAAVGVTIGLRTMQDRQIPRAALMSAVIFLASLVLRLPFGPSSVHPLLNGLAGLILGWAAIPVFLVTLFLQALLFQYGGITTLGINTVTMGLPAVICYYLFNGYIRKKGTGRGGFLGGVAAGVTALVISFVLWAGALLLCGKHLAVIVGLALGPHLGLVLIEGLFTGFAVSFLSRVYPAIFEVPSGREGNGSA
ncbi:MAG: cobalt transporter CbiM [Candidatus Krumholzibacteriota bacterium]|nr:cobalt transporter CbiM [Candidatus Krumholzibacteriota bacterium]